MYLPKLSRTLDSHIVQPFSNSYQLALRKYTPQPYVPIFPTNMATDM